MQRTTADIPSAEDWLERIISDPDQPVVLFGVGWCGFCWSARGMLGRLGVVFRDLDVESEEDLQGQSPFEVRRALRERTGSHTVPQIFIAGHSIGGATELASALNSGALAERLHPLGVTLNPDQ